MAPDNNFGLPNNTFSNDGLSVPSPFTDPLIGNQNNNQGNTTSPIGVPSTDIVQPDSSNGAVSDNGLLSNNAANNPLLVEKTSTTNTDYDPLTGSTLNDPLVGAAPSDDALLGSVNALQLGNFESITDNALSFDNSAYVTIPHSSVFDTNTITIEAWIKGVPQTGGYASWSKIIGKGSDASEVFGIYLHPDTGYIQVNNYIDGNQRVAFDVEVSVGDNNWHHIAYTYDGFTEKFYIDGIERKVNNITGSFNFNSEPITIGREVSSETNQYQFRGNIDEVRIWNVARSQTEIQAYMDRTLSGSELGLIGYWDFNEGSGNTVFDKTNNGNDGKLSSVIFNQQPVWTTRLAPENNALSFNNSDYVTIPHSSVFDTSTITVEAWVKGTSSSTWSKIIGKGADSSEVFGLYLNPYSGTFYVERNIGDNQGYIETDVSIADNKWHHIAYTYDGSTEILYVDGIQRVTNSITGVFSFNSESISIGREVSSSTNQYQFLGSIDEVRIWNVARNQAEIQAEMNSKLTGSEAGLIGYWDFDKGSFVDTVLDKTANGNNGTLSSAELGQQPTWTTRITPESLAYDGEVSENSPSFALSFDGVDDYVQLSNSSIAANLENSTVEIWVNFDSLTSKPQTVYSEDSSGGSIYQITKSNGNLYFDIWRTDTVGNWAGISTPFQVTNKWVHIAAVLDASTGMLLYVNGVLKASESSYTIPSYAFVTSTNLGRITNSGFDYYLDGKIDEVRVWNVARSQADIQANMKLRLTGKEAGLVGYWNLDEGLGNIIFDKTTNSNNGTLGGELLTQQPVWTKGATINNSEVIPQISAFNGIRNEELNSEDAFYPDGTSRYFMNEYQLTVPDLIVGKPVYISVESSDFNTYLEIFDADTGEQLRYNDNSGTGTNSQLFFTTTADINYIVRVSNYGDTRTGAYTLNVKPLPTINAYNGSINEFLNANDASYSNSSTFLEEYQLTNLEPGKAFELNLSSSDFDTCLEIYEINNDNLIYITHDDNLGEGTNSQIIFTPLDGKKYLARVSNYYHGGTGNYTLKSSLPITSPQTRSRIDGALTDSDVNNPTRSGRKSDDYQLNNFAVGQPIGITLSSEEIDGYLQLINADTGAVINFNDNYNSTPNSRLTFTPTENTNYIVRVTSSPLGQLGNYKLYTREVLSGLGDKVNGKISETDSNYPYYGYYIDEYELSDLTIGEFFALELKTENFNPYLELINRDTDEIITVYGSYSSRIVFTPSSGINYAIRVVGGYQTGDYTLTSAKLPTLSAITGTVNVSDTRLSDTDTKYPGTDYLIDEYQLIGTTTGETVYVGLTSPDFNTYLEIVDASNGSYVTGDYDYGDGTNSRIYFTPELGKKYLVRASNYGDTQIGAYTLSTRKQRTEISLPDTSPKQIDGSITYEDELDIALSYYSDEYLLTNLPTSKRIVLDISSEDFYTKIELVDANTGKTILNSLTLGSSKNSKLIFTPQQGISYAVRVRSDSGTGNYTLNINSLTQAIPNSSYGSIILADQPVGYWSLDETTGEIAIDSSGYDNNGSYLDGVTLDATGVAGKAAIFDGENDTLNIPINSPETNYTYELWFKTQEATTGISIVRGNGYDRLLYLKDGNIYHGLWNMEVIGSNNEYYADNEWHHVAVVVESGVGQKIYVDGKLVISGQKGTSDFYGDTNLVVGETLAPGWDSYARFFGALDEIAMYNYVLPESRIVRAL